MNPSAGSELFADIAVTGQESNFFPARQGAFLSLGCCRIAGFSGENA
jgi:hypothetical protein